MNVGLTGEMSPVSPDTLSIKPLSPNKEFKSNKVCHCLFF
jgi:hypothetical protein